MGEGAEERCKVVFLREQALLQSYFSSQVTADQSVAMSVARDFAVRTCSRGDWRAALSLARRARMPTRVVQRTLRFTLLRGINQSAVNCAEK